jgi:hypothetical protein
MPNVFFTAAELEALYAVHTRAERVHWASYDSAKERIVAAGRQHLAQTEGSVGDVQRHDAEA